tara:strand:+ start:10298 stop:11491 length:1194 start_codon:yes stop_codon:yes gene_type:complete
MMDLPTIKSALSAPLGEGGSLPSHVAAFCEFISPWMKASRLLVSPDSGGTYREVAALGYRLAEGARDLESLAKFSDGASLLAGRTFFAGGRALRFEIDGVALLGIALGYQAVKAPSSDTAWLRNCLNQSIAALSDDSWQFSLARAAQGVLSGINSNTDVDPVLTVSLNAAMGEETSQAERGSAWATVIADIDERDATRRAAFQGVYEACAAALARLPVHGAGVRELGELLEGASRSMSHWTYEITQRVKGVAPQTWEINHEYHVQNLLWTILRPVFPDLVDEETLKKLGHTSPRFDLGIPSLHTIVEVKFLRKRGQRALKLLTDEIAADHSLYLREGTGYTKMIAFIWDEQRQTEEYKTFADGLAQLAGIAKVVILPRPARMERIDDTAPDQVVGNE